MTTHAHTETDGILAALKKDGWRVRLVPNPSGNTTLEAWKRTVFLGPSTTVQVTRPLYEDAVRELAAAARSAR